MSHKPSRAPERDRVSDDDGEALTESRVAYCSTCGRETEHDVTVAMVSTATDGINDQHRKFARCPSRVLACTVCGAETRSLVNR